MYVYVSASELTRETPRTRKFYHIMTLTFKHILIILLLFSFTFKVSAQKNQNIVRPKIIRIVTKLERGNEVHFGNPVGVAGLPETNNKYYNLYQKLKRKATNAELIELTKSKSIIIFVYAFKILYSHEYVGLKDIFLRHINDSTLFWTAGGCTGFVEQVNWFMLQLLKPTNKDGSKTYLTKSEYKLYYNSLKEGKSDLVPN